MDLGGLLNSGVGKKFLDKGELPTIVTRIQLDNETLVDLGAALAIVAILAVLLHKVLNL